jgi:hypothetical protein
LSELRRCFLLSIFRAYFAPSIRDSTNITFPNAPLPSSFLKIKLESLEYGVFGLIGRAGELLTDELPDAEPDIQETIDEKYEPLLCIEVAGSACMFSEGMNDGRYKYEKQLISRFSYP